MIEHNIKNLRPTKSNYIRRKTTNPISKRNRQQQNRNKTRAQPLSIPPLINNIKRPINNPIPTDDNESKQLQ